MPVPLPSAALPMVLCPAVTQTGPPRRDVILAFRILAFWSQLKSITNPPLVTVPLTDPEPPVAAHWGGNAGRSRISGALSRSPVKAAARSLPLEPVVHEPPCAPEDELPHRVLPLPGAADGSFTHSWLCTRTSTRPAGNPKLASIWNGVEPPIFNILLFQEHSPSWVVKYWFTTDVLKKRAPRATTHARDHPQAPPPFLVRLAITPTSVGIPCA